MIRPRRACFPPFRDYLRVHLTFQDLQRLVAQAKAHRESVAGLLAVGGVDLIVDSLTGEQCVGSASELRSLGIH
jgi:hypothetical protein